jgi:hypothetical protein
MLTVAPKDKMNKKNQGRVKKKYDREKKQNSVIYPLLYYYSNVATQASIPHLHTNTNTRLEMELKLHIRGM